MGIEQFFENISDFNLEELDEIRGKIGKEITNRLIELPNWTKGCNISEDEDASEEDFEKCEAKQSFIYIWEHPSGYDDPIYRQRCSVCGGEVEEPYE